MKVKLSKRREPAGGALRQAFGLRPGKRPFHAPVLAQSFCVAFSLYSAIPMPRVNWTKENMKYAFCFFPLVGAAIGAAQLLWLQIGLALGHPLVFAAGATAIPLLLTGGIHMDGFCDAMDALGSHGDAEKRLEIMKDSRAGAFAVMSCPMYLLATFALWAAYFEQPTPAVFFLYALSRGLSGFGVMELRCAKGSGLAASFSNAAEKKRVSVVMVLYVLLAAAGMALTAPVAAVLCLLTAVLVYTLYKEMAYSRFGGITGDLAGWFLMVCELCGLAVLVLALTLCG